ncbi:MAG: corrinoid protein [Anaerolineales bacterium]|nr:corrinoid protein [Anaerolineales bacterium]
MSLEIIYQAVIDGDAATTAEEVKVELEKGTSPDDILHKACIAAMMEVGQRFEKGEYFVPEMLIAARAMQGALDILRPYLVETDVASAGKVVMGTVSGGLHDIGKNLVCMMLEGAGFEVIDLGVDVDPELFVDTVRKETPDAIGMSALLTTTMPSMQRTIDALKQAGLRDKVKVMVGGAPLTQDYADQIGADGFAPDASSATRKVKELIGQI